MTTAFQPFAVIAVAMVASSLWIAPSAVLAQDTQTPSGPEQIEEALPLTPALPAAASERNHDANPIPQPPELTLPSRNAVVPESSKSKEQPMGMHERMKRVRSQLVQPTVGSLKRLSVLPLLSFATIAVMGGGLAAAIMVPGLVFRGGRAWTWRGVDRRTGNGHRGHVECARRR